jgi:hypothetical protein
VLNKGEESPCSYKAIGSLWGLTIIVAVKLKSALENLLKHTLLGLPLKFLI